MKAVKKERPPPSGLAAKHSPEQQLDFLAEKPFWYLLPFKKISGRVPLGSLVPTGGRVPLGSLGSHFGPGPTWVPGSHMGRDPLGSLVPTWAGTHLGPWFPLGPGPTWVLGPHLGPRPIPNTPRPIVDYPAP